MVSNIIFEILDVNHVCDGLSLIKHMRRMRWDLRCNVNETCIVDDSWPLCPYGYTGTWASLLMMIQTFGPAYDACMSCDDGMNVWAYHGMAWHGNAGKSPSCHSMGGWREWKRGEAPSCWATHGSLSTSTTVQSKSKMTIVPSPSP